MRSKVNEMKAGREFGSGLLNHACLDLPVGTTKEVSAVFFRIIESGALVPALWRLEVANVLEMGVRKGRTVSAFRDAALADIAFLPIMVDLETDGQAWGATSKLAARHRWTLNDAAYLELACGRGRGCRITRTCRSQVIA